MVSVGFVQAELSPVEHGKINEQRAESEKSGICYVHHVKFEEKETKVSYGLIRPYHPYSVDIEITQFPFANQSANAGCCVPADHETNPKTVTVKFCPECVKAKQKWLEEHKPKETK
jgi:hypothetical protein